MKGEIIKWTPRALVALLGGYYGLGVMYEAGAMALIDQVAISILKHFFGYVGVGIWMPTVQWYSAWAARIIVGIGAGILYDRFERLSKWIYCATFIPKQPEESVFGHVGFTPDFPSRAHTVRRGILPPENGLNLGQKNPEN